MTLALHIYIYIYIIILLLKLKVYGIDGKLVGWIDRFLLNERQRVVINKSAPAWEYVTSVIPQGYVQGPFLFVIYIKRFSICYKAQNVYVR